MAPPMDLQDWIREGSHRWRLPPRDGCSAAVLALASEPLLRGMDERVRQQACCVARLPGLVGPVCLMPDARWGDGLPVGVVAATDERLGGVVLASGAGVDMAGGARCLLTNLERAQVLEQRDALAHALADALTPTPSMGLGLAAMLRGGARWAVEQGWGYPEDLLRCEEHGHLDNADAEAVSEHAKRHQGDGLGVFGCGHRPTAMVSVAMVSLVWVAELFHPTVATQMGLRQGAVAVLILGGCGGLGREVASDYRQQMLEAAPQVQPSLACAPIGSALGQRYLAAVQAVINGGCANRQRLTHGVRDAFSRLWPDADLRVLYDLSYNTCLLEDHLVGHDSRRLVVHRNGAMRAYGPGHGTLPDPFGRTGQPLFVGGAMGHNAYVLAGLDGAEALAFSSASPGLVDGDAVVAATEQAGLAQRVARLEPLISIKG